MMVQAAALTTLDEAARTVEVVFTTGDLVTHWVMHRGEVRRMPTRIVVEEGAVDLEFLRAAGPVLDSHMSYGAAGVIGAVEDAWIENGQGRARIRFADTDDVAPIWQKITQGVLRNISAGFEISAQEARMEAQADGTEVEVMYFTQTKMVELSVCAVPADKGSRIQSDGGRHTSVGGPFSQNTGSGAGDDASRADAATGTVQSQAVAVADQATTGGIPMADPQQSAVTPATPPAVDPAVIR